jgi:hypothetical protein
VWLPVVVVVVIAAAVVTWPTTRTPAPPAPARVSSTASTPPPSPEGLAEPRVAAPAPVPATALVTAAEGATPPGMTLGVAVLDVDTGEVALGRDGGRRFMSASLAKLVVAADVLDRHRAEGRPVGPGDLDLITRALSASDDGAMNVLWGRHGGAAAVDRVADRLGLTASLPAGSAGMWGDVTVTAADLVTLYRHVLRGMAPRDGAVVVGALSAAGAVAADGFAQHYGLLHEGASPRRYAKQAWVPYAPSGYLLHSAGVAYDGRTGHSYAIALLSIQPYSTERTARDQLSSVAAAALVSLTT